MKKDVQVTANIGLYFTCYRLSCLGWNAMPTARNARGVDILAYNRDCTRVISLQVKTLSKRNPVPLGTSLEKIMGDFWIIVNDVQKQPNVYILTANEVKQRADRAEKDGRVSFWLQRRSYEVDGFREAWERMGKPN